MELDPNGADYWAPRRCLREPIPELFQAAFLLEEAVNAHLAGDRAHAQERLIATNTAEIRAYVGSLWHSRKKYPQQVHYFRLRNVATLPERKPKSPDRSPTAAQKREVVTRDGYVCRYCGIPTIPVEVRDALRMAYPDELPWPRIDAIQHSAFQALWLQYDHVIPHSYGGDNDVQNIVVSCGGCNFGKNAFHLLELGLEDPRSRPPLRSSWNGLIQILSTSR
ncbi:MAG: HNH endonuclease [Jannaschia helgolandensis]